MRGERAHALCDLRPAAGAFAELAVAGGAFLHIDLLAILHRAAAGRRALSVGPHVARTAKERAARQAHLQQAESDFDPVPFGPDAARAFGRVAASLRSAGRKPAARAYDALIAAKNS